MVAPTLEFDDDTEALLLSLSIGAAAGASCTGGSLKLTRFDFPFSLEPGVFDTWCGWENNSGSSGVFERLRSLFLFFFGVGSSLLKRKIYVPSLCY